MVLFKLQLMGTWTRVYVTKSRRDISRISAQLQSNPINVKFVTMSGWPEKLQSFCLDIITSQQIKHGERLPCVLKYISGRNSGSDCLYQWLLIVFTSTKPNWQKYHFPNIKDGERPRFRQSFNGSDRSAMADLYVKNFHLRLMLYQSAFQTRKVYNWVMQLTYFVEKFTHAFLWKKNIQ